MTRLIPRFVRRTPVGHVDTLEGRRLYGWVWQPAAPRRRLLVDVFLDGAFHGQQLSHRYRHDLRDQSIGDGFYGFEVDLGEGAASARAIDVFALDDGQRSRLASSLPTAFAQIDPIVREPNDYIRATFRSILDDVGEGDVDIAPAAAMAEPLYERLFAPSPVPSDPVVFGTRLCAYLDFVRLRSDLRDVDPSLTQNQYRTFLRSYLQSYGKVRGRARAPMSAADIAFLNAPDANGNSCAQALWTADYDLPVPERAFRWAAFVAPALSVEDCLIPDEDIATLSEVVSDGPFPLSHFIVRLLQQNPLLRALPISRADERAFVIFVVLLLATRQPHILMFVDAEALDALLSGGDTSRFDLFWRSIFGNHASPAELWRRAIARRGFDLSRRRYRSIAPSGSRLAAPGIVLRNARRVDVQVFGPFSRALGIGQSARRLAASLRDLDYSIRFCDFAMDHPNARVTNVPVALEQPGPSRVNILHLNLEDIPTLVAYSANVFSGSRRVAVPYLELTPVSPAQYLGLDLVDEVWAATHFVADTVRPHRPAFVIGASVEPIKPRGRLAARNLAYQDRVTADDFVFLTAGDAFSGVNRKNPLGAIRSFLQAFPSESGVRLVIKTHSTEKVVSPFERSVWSAIRDICATDPRIVLIDRLLPDDAHHALVEGADCLVSLHRSEGLGFHILEAMRLGVPVIATSYAGPADFCTNQTAFLCDYRLVHVDPRHYARSNANQVWADPDLAQATRHMLAVFHDRSEHDAIVANARRLTESDYSPQALGVRLDIRLTALFKAQGR